MKSILLGGAAKNLQRELSALRIAGGANAARTANKATKRDTVPVFFAVDDNYLPFLDVAIDSLRKNASKQYRYNIHILHSGISEKGAEKIMRHSSSDFKIGFVNVEEQLDRIASFLNLRDYYTPAIYYRLFIVEMFPQYKKAVYLDCDTVILGDVSELYSANLGNHLIGAVADGVVRSVPVFQEYAKTALGVESDKYFNSGVIVMNLESMRKMNFYRVFGDTLEKYRFRVAPDQDCLNMLCKGRVHYFSEAWNRMPQGEANAEKAKLVHYNLAQKPWHYDGIRYEEYFWEYAKSSVFYREILEHKASFSPQMAKRDEEGGAALLALAAAETERKKN